MKKILSRLVTDQTLGIIRKLGIAASFVIASLAISPIVSSPAHAQEHRQDPGAVEITNKHKSLIIDSITAALNEYYIFEDVAKDMEKKVKKSLRSREYKDLNTMGEFVQQLTEDLRSVSHDLHLRIRASEMTEDMSEEEDPEAEQARRDEHLASLRAQNFSFKAVEIMPGNIGYLDLRGFAPAEWAGPTAVAAMNFLAHTDAIIFDLRHNGGGSPSMIQLLTSYLLDEATHINSFYIRKDDHTEQFWTQHYVTGPKMVETPVYILTSGSTFSAAEEFTYNLKNLERATIVGETTGGGAHPVSAHYFKIDDALFVEMSMPYGRAINPITGTNWEGTGIDPHIAVPADQALDAAQLDILEKRLDTDVNEDSKFETRWALTALRARLDPIVIDDQTALAYTGSFGPRHIMFEGGQLKYQRDERPVYPMIALGNHTFGLDGLDYFRLEFVKDESGEFNRVVGTYSNGRRDGNDRSEPRQLSTK